MKENIALVGAGALGLNVAGIVQALPQYNLLGFIDTNQSPVAGIDVIGDDSALDDLLGRGVRHVVVCIGSLSRRLALGDDLRQRGFELPSIIHPAAAIGVGATVGTGTIIFPGTLILPQAEIGEFCVIEAGGFVGHHTRIGRGALVAARAVVGNRVTVDDGVTVGMGAMVRSGSHVPADAEITDFEIWS